MRLRFIGSNIDLLPNATYIPIDMLEGDLDFWVEDCDGFHLYQEFLEEDKARRNGLPQRHNTFSYNGNMHIFSLFNKEEDDVELMMKINRLMVYPYTYICPFEEYQEEYTFIDPNTNEEATSTITKARPTYDANTTAILKLIIQNMETLSESDPTPIITPSAIRVSFQQITTTHNDGIGANKEYDLDFSVYGIWNKNGLMEA